MSPERKEKVKKENYALVYAIIQDGEILLEERRDPKKKYYGQATIPMTGIKSKGSIWHKLDEIMERQYGCQPRTASFLKEFTHDYTDNNYKRYLVLVEGIRGHVSLKNSNSQHHFWASLEEAHTFCAHPHMQEFLTEIENYLAGKNQ